MHLEFALAQDIGTRSEQQDSGAVCPLVGGKGVLCVIADGLGGHTGGARASHIAVKTFVEAGETGRLASPEVSYEQLGQLLEAANGEIARAAKQLSDKETMGTTLVAAVAAWNSIGWISVGDSHLYLWRGDRLKKLNEDHSQAGLMIKSGRFKDGDSELDAYRSLLRSALTGRELTLIDRPLSTVELQHHDIVILATDGLNTVDFASVERIAAAQAGRGADKMAAALIEAVRKSEQPSRDNSTVIVARVLALDGAEEPVATAEDAPVTELRPRSVPLVSPQSPTTTAIVTTPFFKTGPAAAAIEAQEADGRARRRKMLVWIGLGLAAFVAATIVVILRLPFGP